LVLLKKTDVFKTVIPTKMLEFMSCARPVILGVEGQARMMVEEAEAGLAIEPENAEELVRAVQKLAENPEFGAKLGRNGREYIQRNYSRRKTAENYIQVLQQLLSPR
jgi:glycosyltransferase involved in cell wall biosynthesis